MNWNYDYLYTFQIDGWEFYIPNEEETLLERSARQGNLELVKTNKNHDILCSNFH